MRILMVGDVVGRPGRRAVQQLLRNLARAHRADFVIVNCENAATGSGVTPEIAEELFQAGADCLTSGNHIWKHRVIYPYLEDERRLLRPANYPEGTPGAGWGVYSTPVGEIGVINLLGTAMLDPLDCPFRMFDQLYDEIHAATSVIIVDFHAEFTSEKGAFANYVDGRASVVFGTHTHVQTADERLLPGGTGFITDIGMTGPEDSILGVSKELVIERFLTRLPVRFEIANHPPLLCGLVADVDAGTGKTLSVTRIQERAH